jgi:hypothetical protein
MNYDECERVKQYIIGWKKDLVIDNENDFTKELSFVYELISHSVLLNETYLKLQDFKAGRTEVQVLLDDINKLIAEYPKIWNRRNKLSDFKYSNFRLKMLKLKYENLLKIYNLMDKL